MLSARQKFAPLSAFFLIALYLPSKAESRRWEDVVSVAIYSQSYVDIPRIQYSLEEDPLIAMEAPTVAESFPPSDVPSSVPSYAEEVDRPYIENNGADCPSGQSPYKVNKYGAWEGGWGDSSLTIRQKGTDVTPIQADSVVSEGVDSSYTPPATKSSLHRGLDYVSVGSLKNGDFDEDYVCLAKNACYEVELEGEKWQEEAKWEIIPFVSHWEEIQSPGVAIAKGRGLSNCTFYTSDSAPILGDILGDTDCRFTCQPKHEDEVSQNVSFGIASNISTQDVAFARAETPTVSPTQTIPPSRAPSDAPSLVPTL